MAVAWPFAARAQQTEGMKRVAILMGGAENQEGQERVAAFRQGLGDRHWQEGRNVHIDIRWGSDAWAGPILSRTCTGTLGSYA